MVELKLIMLLALLMPFQEPTPSGTIAFVRGDRIILIDANGKNERVLLGGLWGKDRQEIDWSPDGTTLVYPQSFHDPAPARSGRIEIWSTDLQAKQQRRLASVHFPTSVSIISPRFSPDGKHIAFMRNDPPGLHVMDVDGKNERRLSKSGLVFATPHWSPDGKKIAFEDTDEERRGLPVVLVILDLEKNTEKSIKHSGWDYSWSPDGKKLVCLGVRVVDSQQQCNVWLFDPDTGAETNLTKSHANKDEPRWSPDGRLISYLSYNKAKDFTELCVMDPEGNNPRVIAESVSYGRGHCWSPDEQWLVYPAGDHGKEELFIVSVKGGAPRKLTGGGAEWPTWQPRKK
jgi:Tol biopolymer transport system component